MDCLKLHLRGVFWIWVLRQFLANGKLYNVKNNLYYYSFYRISTTIKKIGTKNNDFVESGCAFFALRQSLNVLALLFLLEHYLSFKVPGSYLFSAIIFLPIWFINRKVLLPKKDEIFAFYDQVSKNSKARNVLLFLYVVLSIAIPILLASMHRSGRW